MLKLEMHLLLVLENHVLALGPLASAVFRASIHLE